MRALRVLAIALLGLGAGLAQGHEFSVTDVLFVLKSDGSYQVDLRVDLDALALGVSPTADSSELAARLDSLGPAEFEATVERARETIVRRVRLRFDGDKQRPLVSFPTLDNPPPEPPAVPTVLGTLARLEGRAPDGAAETTFGASRAFGPVQLTIVEQATLGGMRRLLVPGEDSPPYRIGQEVRAAAPRRADVAGRYLVLGFEHIVPRGADHVLFVIALFLLGARWKPLLWQITAFTVAHSVTLALSITGRLALPSRWVETLIALSIAYVAVENLFTSDLKPWRPVLVFGFGLLHGLGFAGVLRELGLPDGEFVTALVSFNVGVEAGQLAVIAGAFLILGHWRGRETYRSRVVLPISGLIAIMGAYWAVERALGAG